MRLTKIAFNAWKDVFESIGCDLIERQNIGNPLYDSPLYADSHGTISIPFLHEQYPVFLQTKSSLSFDEFFINPIDGESRIAVSFVYDSSNRKPLNEYTKHELGYDHVINANRDGLIAFGSFNKMKWKIEHLLLITARQFLDWYWFKDGACIDRRYEDITIKQNISSGVESSFVKLPVYYLEQFAFEIPYIGKSDGFKTYTSKTRVKIP